MTHPHTHPAALQGRESSPVVLLAFWVYAIALFLGSKTLAHHWFAGMAARLATMGLVALGLWPWRPWLAPRLARALGLLGRAAVVACYACLAPVAFVVRAFRDPLRLRRPAGASSRWMARRPLPKTLEEARLES